MKHSLLHTALVYSVFIVNIFSFQPSVLWSKWWSGQQIAQMQTKTDATAHSAVKVANPFSIKLSDGFQAESPTAQVTDSLALVELYNSTTSMGPWDFGKNWNFTQRVCDWFGVTLDSEGYVTHLQLNSSGLNGTLPNDIGDLSRMVEFNVGDNRISGGIPTTIGQVSTLEILKLHNNFSASSGFSGRFIIELSNLVNLNTLWLDGNRFTDTIPKEIGRLVMLNALFLDNNEFSGAIPDSFVHLTNLTKLDIYNNQFDSLPDLSSINSLFIQTNKLEIQNNRFTFDDILPNTGTALGNNYQPQDSIFEEQTVSLFTGTTYRIDLGIDRGISNNSYQWYKDGLPFGSPTNVNYLEFSPVKQADAGVYKCQVTNPGAPLLTLYSRCVTVTVSCGTSINDIVQDICQGDEIIVNGTTYDCDNDEATIFLPGADQFGCDSIINIQLTCTQPVDLNQFDTVCPGDTVFVNDQPYYEGNAEGWEIVNTDGMGCDTTIHVLVSFYTNTASSSLNTTICKSDSILVNGRIYKCGQSSGMEILEGMSFRGCDSIINVELNFYPDNVATFDDMLCSGGSITVNGIVYDEGNPTGRDTIPKGSMINGCDSIMVIDLSFGSFASSNQDFTICHGDSITINGRTYHEDFTSATDTLLGQGLNGCDSLVFVNVDVLNENRVFFSPFLCAGDTVHVNGTIYGQAPDYPSTGTEILQEMGGLQCDSVVEVILNFFPAIGMGMIEPTLCNCDTVIVNGTIYDCNNPTGTETIEGVAANGCDSTYQINLTHLAAPTGNFMPTICEGGSITYNGTIYDEGNPSGTEIVPGPTPSDCDSVITVEVSFFTPTPGTFNMTVCEGESFEFNGTTYDVNTPCGLETLPDPGFGGCDSTVNFCLSFYTPSEMGMESETICLGGSTVIHGQTLDASNPIDTVSVGQINANGCDSLVEVSIDFFPEVTDILDTTICAEASFTVNGTLYGSGGSMTGTEVLTGASPDGCNVELTINVSNFDIPTGTQILNLCVGESTTYNGNLYGEGGLTSGVELAPSPSFQGCDSMVNVSVVYFPESPNGVFSPMVCLNQDTMYNGTIYNFVNPNGLEVLTGVTDQYGCDSTVQVQLSFFPEVIHTINQTLCEGTSIMVNNVVYDVDNPNGTEVVAGGATTGCDSTIIVDLSFNTFVVNNISETLCNCESITINDTLYDCNNPIGSDTLFGASYIGCDSIINVQVDFLTSPETDYTPTLCPGESVVVNGTLYSEAMPMGTEIFSGNICDSTVNVALNFHAPAVMNIDTTVCAGEPVIINGMSYDPDNTPSTEVINGASANGCDSMVMITVQYFDPVVNVMDQMLCTGETIEINGNTYGDGFPLMGEEIVMSGASNGCDSTITIDLTIADFISFDLDPTLCEDEFVEVKDNIYDINNPTGQEIFPQGSLAGCDSIVNINLSFYPPAVETIDPTLCDCVSMVINGTVYDCNNPSGTEILESVNGCDSTITVDLQFYPAVEVNYSPTFCPNDSEVINGTLYYIGNPSGTEVIGGATVNGCDSTIFVSLNFHTPAESTIDTTLCEGESLEINGVIFDAANPSGSTIYEAASINGCDSTVNVELAFHTPASSAINSTLCPGESLELNGIIFDEANPTGSTIYENASANGCDSTVTVNLTFHEAAINNLNSTLCQGASLEINGTIYDENNPNGTEVLTGTSSNGCDSTIQIALNFTPAISNELNAEICAGDSYTINGVDYSSTGTFTEIITGGSIQGCDSIIVLELMVQDAASLGFAEAGTDVSGCADTVSLAANLPDNTTGVWSSMTNAEFAAANAANTTVSNLSSGQNLLIWTLSTDACPDYDADTLVVDVVDVTPITADDIYQMPRDSQSLTIDVLANDDLTQLSGWTFELLGEPESGTLTSIDEGQFVYQPLVDFPGGTVSFNYQICNIDCPELCNEATVSISIEALNIDPDIEIPSGITPNDDGLNEFFVIPDIQNNPDRYTESELVIYNRWGDVVYSARPYQNDWNGRTNGGKSLPQGTYYFVLRVDFGEGKIYKGDITILR